MAQPVTFGYAEANSRMCDEHARNRAKWGRGPWDGEPDRIEFEAHGLPCILHRGGVGAWCGYVGLSPSHPFHGRDYNDVPDIDVHGGLTYAEKCACHVPKPGESDDLWWLGFDCAHSGDAHPTPSMSFQHGEYRDMAYARHETERLAKQLAEAAK